MNRTPKVLVPFVLIGLLAMLAGCTGDPQDVSPTSNDQYKVDLLFEHEGCRVYRFRDGNDRIYYAHCQHGIVRTERNEYHSTGKSGYTERHAITTQED